MKIKKEYVLRPFADRFLAISTEETGPEQNVLITLNSSGAYVWQLLQQPMSYEQVLHKLMEKYDVDEQLARADLDRFIAAVKKANLLEE